MIKKAYIHEYGQGKMESEHANVQTVLEERNIPCELFTTKRLSRNQLDLRPEHLVVGDHDVMKTVFKRMGVEVLVDSYPMVLHPFLKRTIQETTLGQLIAKCQNALVPTVFIKPKNDSKAFTGFILETESELWQLDQYSRQMPIYISALVDWKAEYRVFVHHGEIVGIKCYSGDSAFELDLSEIDKAIKIVAESEYSTAGYGIDFGVLSSGETALVEWNDGFALGSYGLEKELYAALLVARWEEIIAGIK